MSEISEQGGRPLKVYADRAKHHARLVGCLVLVTCGGPPRSDASGSASTSTSTPTEETGATAATVDMPTTDGASDLPADCDPAVAFPEMVVVVDEPLGIVSHYDMDDDGAVDAVGGRGVIVLANGNARKIADVPPTNNGRPGQFVAGGLPDLLYATSTNGQFLVFPAAASEDAPAPVVATEGSTAGAFVTADYDGDNVDDVALSTATTGEVQLWRGQPDGTFEAGPRLDDLTFPTAGFMRYGDAQAQHLVVAELDASEVVLFQIDGASLIEVATFVQPGVHLLTGLDPDGSGIEHLLLDVWWDNGFETFSSVGLVLDDGGAWEGPYYDLGEQLARDYVPADLDADGDLDLVLVTTGPEQHVEMLCLSPAGYALCGRMTPDVEIQNLGVLVDPLRLLVSTDDDTRVATLTLPPCAEP